MDKPDQPEKQAPNLAAKRRVQAERSLSSLVITIEFTLISVMAGVVLAPLATFAAPLISNLRFETWPYILFGLLYILFMWSGVISHAFTFVSWPFELGHNLLYIVWALVLAMQMTFVEDPASWFILDILQFMVVGWIGFYDLRILLRRMADATPAARTLFEIARRRQVSLILLLPVAAGSAVLSLALLRLFPAFFIGQHAHWILGSIQVLGVCVGLLQNMRALVAWQEPIIQKEMAELEES